MHSHGPVTGNRLKIAAGITGIFVVAEFLIGWWANSLALISDSGHNLTDVAALILSAWAFAMANRAPDRQRTFGYHRVGVLAALANAVTLILLAIYIFYEGYQRLTHPELVASLPMIIVALIALVLNTSIALALHHGSHDVNVRAAFIHMVGDAVSSIGVVIAGIGIWLSGSTVWDPVVSLIIGAFILWSSWSIIRETINILLESTPEDLDLQSLTRDVEAVPGVANIHDLHVWSLSSDIHALAAHIAVEEQAEESQTEVRAILINVRKILRDQYGIDHSTLETHCVDEPTVIDDGTDCALHPERVTLHAGHDYHHDHSHSH